MALLCIGFLIAIFVAFVGYLIYHSYHHLASCARSIEEMRVDPDEATAYWPYWLSKAYPIGQLGAPRFTRDDALRELDHWLTDSWGSAALQRTAIMAPLFGVCLTVAGLMFWQPDTKAADQGLMGEVRSLFIGVFTGAILALVNQGALFLIGRQLARVRRAGREYFDEAVWAKRADPSGDALGKAVVAIDRLAQVCDEAATRYQSCTSYFESATNQLRAAAVGAAQHLETAGPRFTRIADVLAKLEPITQPLERCVQRVDTATREFADAVTNYLHPGAKQFQAASTSIGGAATHLSPAATKFEQVVSMMDSSVKKLDQAAGTHLQAMKNLDGTISQMGSAHQNLTQAVTGLSTTTTDFNTKVVPRWLQQVDAVTTALAQFTGTATALKQILTMQPQLDSLLQSLTKASQVVSGFAQLPGELQKAHQQITVASTQTATTLTTQVGLFQTSMGTLLGEARQHLQTFIQQQQQVTTDVIEQQVRELESVFAKLCQHTHPCNGANNHQ